MWSLGWRDWDDDLSITFENAGKWELYFAVLLYTGLRAGDAAMLTYGNIDFSQNVIITLVRKSRRVHEFPLSDHLVSLIPKSKDDNEPLFPTLYVTKTNSVGEIVADERILHYRIGIPRKRFQMILKEADRPRQLFIALELHLIICYLPKSCQLKIVKV